MVLKPKIYFLYYYHFYAKTNHSKNILYNLRIQYHTAVFPVSTVPQFLKRQIPVTSIGCFFYIKLPLELFISRQHEPVPCLLYASDVYKRQFMFYSSYIRLISAAFFDTILAIIRKAKFITVLKSPTAEPKLNCPDCTPTLKT